MLRKPVRHTLLNHPTPAPNLNQRYDLQAEDRVHRMGQTAPVRVWRVGVVGSVEECVVGVAEGKAAIAEDLLKLVG